MVFMTSFFCSAKYFQGPYMSIYEHISVLHFFLLLNKFPFNEYTTFCLPIQQLTDFWVLAKIFKLISRLPFKYFDHQAMFSINLKKSLSHFGYHKSNMESWKIKTLENCWREKWKLPLCSPIRLSFPEVNLLFLVFLSKMLSSMFTNICSQSSLFMDSVLVNLPIHKMCNPKWIFVTILQSFTDVCRVGKLLSCLTGTVPTWSDMLPSCFSAHAVNWWPFCILFSAMVFTFLCFGWDFAV